MSEWTIQVNGGDQISVKPGERVEIGRKPLRPLADDGNTRFDVVDRTKSMSKRHALFEVKSDGAASVTDLESTNGSYLVRDNGDLLRLPPDIEFLLPTSRLRMQFGDVQIDFARDNEAEESDQSQRDVPDLFGYAVNEPSPEPDAADMSVDDILDLRAGEPTTMFSADNVKRKVGELDVNGFALQQPEPDQPRDLFEDARNRQLFDTQDNELDQSPTRMGAGGEYVPVEAIAHPAALVQTPDAGQENGNGDSSPSPESNESQKASSPAPDDSASDTVALSKEQQQSNAEPADTSASSEGMEVTEPAADIDGEDGPSKTANTEPVDESNDVEPNSALSAVGDGAQRDDPDATGVYTPAFEPGSVFDRVAKGELKVAQQMIEVDGMTSEDAKSTQDFSRQFDMARHPELLAFLAMNPYLYDDLYAWLAARGEADIDEALSHNQGYRDYLEAIGK